MNVNLAARKVKSTCRLRTLRGARRSKKDHLSGNEQFLTN
jgi:hypothetical protein